MVGSGTPSDALSIQNTIQYNVEESSQYSDAGITIKNLTQMFQVERVFKF